MDTHQESRMKLQDMQWVTGRCILALKERSRTILSIREQMEQMEGKGIIRSRNK